MKSCVNAVNLKRYFIVALLLLDIEMRIIRKSTSNIQGIALSIILRRRNTSLPRFYFFNYILKNMNSHENTQFYHHDIHGFTKHSTFSSKELNRSSLYDTASS